MHVLKDIYCELRKTEKAGERKGYAVGRGRMRYTEGRTIGPQSELKDIVIKTSTHACLQSACRHVSVNENSRLCS